MEIPGDVSVTGLSNAHINHQKMMVKGQWSEEGLPSLKVTVLRQAHVQKTCFKSLEPRRLTSPNLSVSFLTLTTIRTLQVVGNSILQNTGFPLLKREMKRGERIDLTSETHTGCLSFTRKRTCKPPKKASITYCLRDSKWMCSLKPKHWL